MGGVNATAMVSSGGWENLEAQAQSIMTNQGFVVLQSYDIECARAYQRFQCAGVLFLACRGVNGSGELGLPRLEVAMDDDERRWKERVYLHGDGYVAH